MGVRGLAGPQDGQWAIDVAPDRVASDRDQADMEERLSWSDYFSALLELPVR